ncbi:MAG: hypothetical protein U0R64_01600 [Candidatus Nanopelagicales bacterium]
MTPIPDQRVKPDDTPSDGVLTDGVAVTHAPLPAPWAEGLLDLVVQEATGRVVLSGSAGEYGWVYLRDGLLSGISAGARRPLLAQRLAAFAALPPVQIDQALAAVKRQPGLRLLDLIVAERLVPQGFVETYLRNVMAEHLAVLLHGPPAQLRLESGRVQRSAPLLLDPHEVLSLALVVPYAFPDEVAEHAMTASGNDYSAAATIHQSVLAVSDGRRRPVDVADECGLTAGETLQVIAELQQHGALELTPSGAATWSDPLAGPPPPPAATPPTLPPPRAATPPPVAAPPPRPEPEPTAEPVVTPFAPEPVEEEPTVRPPRSGESRREALNALKNLTDALVDPDSAPAPGPAETPSPQAAVTTTGRVWSVRPQRPADPMESGDVLRELKSLEDQG